jgi:hypothetical protein
VFYAQSSYKARPEVSVLGKYKLKSVSEGALTKALARFRSKVEELNADQVHEIEYWMKTDNKWRFLRESESLVEVVGRDSATLSRLGISHEEVANRLASLINQFHYNCVKTRIYSGEAIQQVEKIGTVIEGRYFINVIDELGYMDRQPCYFEILNNAHSLEELIKMNREAGVSEELCKPLARKQYLKRAQHTTASATYRIVDLRRKKRLFFSSSLEFAAVMIHSIRAHHFFGGPGTRMRVDPKKLVEFLQLESGKVYSPNTQELSVWSGVDHTSSLVDDCRESALARKFGFRVALQDGLTAYLWVNEGVILSENHIKLEKPLVINDVLVDLHGNEVQSGQTIIHYETMFFDIG